MSQVLEILTLQSLDDEAAALRAALADTERRLQGDEELNGARRDLAAVRTRQEAARRDQRRLEGEVEALSDKIAADEKKLYDGSIHSPKELTNLQHEVDTLKASRATHEDALIEALDTAEKVNREAATAERRARVLEGRWQLQQQELRHEVLRLGDAIARTDAKRDLQKTRIPPRSLHLYEDLRRRKGGMAVSRLTGGSCGGCRVSVPDGIRRKALAISDIAQCPNCERILSVG